MRICILFTLLLLVACQALPSTTPLAPGSAGAGVTSTPPPPPPLQQVQPLTIPFDAPEITNPLRGLYRWRRVEAAPLQATVSYERYLWRELEPSSGTYDFSLIERDLREAEQNGRRHGFRIQALITDAPDGPQVPGYLVERMERGWWHDYDSSGDAEIYVPDWNDPDFLERAAALLTELGRRYNNDPRVAFVDIGIYGNWGEWHMYGFPYPGPSGAEPLTTESMRHIVGMYLNAFPNKPLIMMTDHPEALLYALRQSPRVGWRRDSLGSTHFDLLERRIRELPDGDDAWELVSSRWKTAPIITEFINLNHPSRPAVPMAYYNLAREQVLKYKVSLVGNGNTFLWDELSEQERSAFLDVGKATGYRLALAELLLPSRLLPGQEFRVSSRWENRGVAPVYENWTVTLELRDTTGQARWSGVLEGDLRRALPGRPIQLAGSWIVPGDLPAGHYELVLVIRDPQQYQEPLALAIQGRRPDGGYHLGDVTVR